LLGVEGSCTMALVKSDPLGWQGATLDDRFVVEELVGEGGFGLVYRARHLGLREPVAVKCLKIPTHLDDEQQRALMDTFREEARLLHRLSRKTAGIVQALDVGAAISPKGIWTPYIVMEWLEGHTLEREIVVRAHRTQPSWSAADAVALLEPAARALAVAHTAGVAHLDVKPANLFITEDDGGSGLKVLDFGIARALSGDRTLARALTQDGRQAAFTPGYAAPEQYHRRHGKPGPATDVFALGLVLLELASGQPALDGETPMQLYIAAANDMVRPSFAAAGVAVNPLLEQALGRALDVDPTRRFADAGSMWDALIEAVEAEAQLTPTERPLASVRISVVPGSIPSAPTQSQATMGPIERTTGSQRRLCTVLVAELGSPTTTARHFDPEALASFVERCLDAIFRVIEDADGVVEQHIGSSVVASFGLRSDSASAAERAVGAALRLERIVAELPIPRVAARPTLRVGIDTGRVYTRATTRATASGPVMMGAPVNLATRLGRAADAGATLIGRDTYRQVASMFEVDRVSLPRGDGEEDAHAYRVRGPVRGEEALGLLAQTDFVGRPTVLVGRAAEMEALAAAADAAARGSGAQLALLVGAAGIGKSRLVYELARRLEAEGFALFVARSSPLSQRSSYALAAALLRARFHIHDDDTRETAEDKLLRGMRALRRSVGETVERYGETSGPFSVHLGVLDQNEIAAQLLRVLGYPLPRSSAEELAADDRSAPVKHRIAAAFAALAASARQPIAFLCDDAHAADEASLELFDDMLLRLPSSPVLVVCAAQPRLLERRPDWLHSEARRRTLSLAPLSRRHLEEMARDRLARVEALPRELVANLAERAEGYPLTLVETLHLLIDASAIDTSHDVWRLDESRMGELKLPTTVQGIVQARLDQLDERSLDLLCKAAVIGPVFWDGALAELDGGLAADRGPVVAALAQLAERGLVQPRSVTTFPGELEHAFMETALSEVAYEMLPQAERRDLHRAVAAWLERHLAGDAGAALVARHHERGAALDDALRAYTRAGAHAASLGQNAEAVHCYERACRLDRWMGGEEDAFTGTAEAYLYWEAPGDPRVALWPERVSLFVELGDVLRRIGRLEQAEKRYEQARARIVREERRSNEVYDEREAARWDARIDFRLAHLQDVRGELPEARALIERALEHAERGELGAERAQMLAHLAGLHLREQDTAASLAASLAGLRICRGLAPTSERRREAESWLLRTLGGVFYHRGRLVRAERCYLQSARSLDETRHPLALARVLNNVAATRFARGDIEAARDAFRRAFELAGRSGDLWMTMTTLGNLGEVEHALGRREAARDFLEEAVRLGEAMGAGADVAECHRNLARVLLDLGEHEPALASARRALDHARTGARVYLLAVVETATAICRAVAAGPARTGAQALARDLLEILERAPEAQPELAGTRRALAALLEPESAR
jgi:serine/threonine protein kinase/tetratricopeptide (TPR) repeat protein